MRVHPNVLHPTNSRWQFALVIVVLVLLMLVPRLFKSSGRGSNSSATSKVLTTDIVMLRVSVIAGTLLDDTLLIKEKRPVPDLPADVITRAQDVIGKRAAGPIPAGYPLSKTFLITEEDYRKENSVDVSAAKLNAIKGKTVVMILPFKTPLPEKGSRISLHVQGPRGQSVLVAEDAWVEDLTENAARVRVYPQSALFLEEVKTLGQLSYLVIADEGQNPFQGQAITDIYEVKKRLHLDAETLSAKRASSALSDKQGGSSNSGNFGSYAWATGDKVMYGVNKDGRIHVIDAHGLVTPLYNYRFSGLEGSDREESQVQSTIADSQRKQRVQRGLEEQ